MKIIIVALFFGLLYSCSPEKYKEIGLPENVVHNLSGTWKLTKVTQTDEDAARKGFPFTKTDLTTAFPYTDFILTLNFNGGVPGTFTTIQGSAPRIISVPSGNWKLDDPSYPKIITMYNNTDTANVTLGSYPTLSNPYLRIAVNRFDASSGKLLISYNYEFTKQ